MANSFSIYVYKEKDKNGRVGWFLSTDWYSTIPATHIGPLSKAALFLKIAEVLNG